MLVQTDPSLLRKTSQTAESAPPDNHTQPQVILSFDVEEHHRIEAAAGLSVDPALKAHYRNRMDVATRWILDQLAEREIRATFFIVGQIARRQAPLIRAIHEAGHEVASHGWDHRRVHHFTPATFREDIRKSKDALEQVTGEPVVGYRAPTFSVMRQTAWALDVLAEAGMLYDSSIYPVRHDRYGVPDAPRGPFLALGENHSILEIPPVTLRVLGLNLPMGGGGYFRLFPSFLFHWALKQTQRRCRPPVSMLYFHPWEFDPQQARLPLRALNRFRTYVGLGSSQSRLMTLLSRHSFCRAADVAFRLKQQEEALPLFALVPRCEGVGPFTGAPAPLRLAPTVAPPGCPPAGAIGDPAELAASTPLSTRVCLENGSLSS